MNDEAILSRLKPELRARLGEVAFLTFVHVSDLQDAIRRFSAAKGRVQIYGNAKSENFEGPLDKDSLFFGSLRETAEAFSSISRIFFPSNPIRIRHIENPETKEEYAKRKDISTLRGAVLRGLFEIHDDSSLASTLLRNRLVHMDEDVDLNFVRRGGQVTLRRITAPERDKVEGIPDDATFERFDPETNTYIVLGHKFPLNEIISIVYNIEKKCLAIQSALARSIPRGSDND